MNKGIGYAVAVVGLALMIVGFGIFNVGILDGINSTYVSGAGVILVIVGVVLSLSGKGGRRKVSSGEDEVPIYKGTGKNRRVVGYRKD